MRGVTFAENARRSVNALLTKNQPMSRRRARLDLWLRSRRRTVGMPTRSRQATKRARWPVDSQSFMIAQNRAVDGVHCEMGFAVQNGNIWMLAGFLVDLEHHQCSGRPSRGHRLEDQCRRGLRDLPVCRRNPPRRILKVKSPTTKATTEGPRELRPALHTEPRPVRLL
jgi:hypothetical protein